jgi:hypothetical protein
MRLNLNEIVKFRLTYYGNKVLNEYLDNQTLLYGCNASSSYMIEPDGYVHSTLKDFIRVFRNSCGPYNPLLLVDGELVIGE